MPILGRHDSGHPGPTVLIIGGIHGNEPAGLMAAREVLARLERGRLGRAGRVVAVAANQPALAVGRRYINRDLNRVWSADAIAALEQAPADTDDAEQGQQRVLLSLFRQLRHEAEAGDQPLVFVDLHSTSGPAAPFTIINDTLESRRLALASPVPLVLGLEEIVRGTLLDYVEQYGHPCVIVEGGQHDDPATAVNLESVVWHVLGSLGMVASHQVRAFPVVARPSVPGVPAGQPRVIEVFYVHEIASATEFEMRPGYASFVPVRAGELLAHDHGTEVRAPADGLLLLPLYQSWGTDGYFLGRPVNRAWLTGSRLVRAAAVARLLPLLPGVARDPARSNVVHVDRRIARWLVVQVFHLAGYRRLPSGEDRLSFRRRE